MLAILAELATQQLVSIWFAAGSLGALITAAAGGSATVQLILFVGLSMLLLICTRPILRKVLHFEYKDTNAKMDIGKLAIIVQEVNSEKGTGRARLGDSEWIAVAENGSVIPKGTTVRVDRIDGAKLYVSLLPEKEVQASNS